MNILMVASCLCFMTYNKIAKPMNACSCPGWKSLKNRYYDEAD